MIADRFRAYPAELLRRLANQVVPADDGANAAQRRAQLIGALVRSIRQSSARKRRGKVSVQAVSDIGTAAESQPEIRMRRNFARAESERLAESAESAEVPKKRLHQSGETR